jgi:3-oxoacyl-[acyl-carrier protein] reductase
MFSVTSEITAAGGQAEFVKTNVTIEADWKNALDVATSKFGRLDILVNNAGWTYRLKDSLTVTEVEYDREYSDLDSTSLPLASYLLSAIGIFDINVKGIFHSVNIIMPHFLAQGSGNIINIGSCITARPGPGLLWYGATKGAVDMVTRCLAAEFTPRGVRVNGISPSMGETPLMGDFLGKDPTDQIRLTKSAEAPLNRLCTPLDIAKAALYFATPYFNDFQTYVQLDFVKFGS